MFWKYIDSMVTIYLYYYAVFGFWVHERRYISKYFESGLESFAKEKRYGKWDYYLRRGFWCRCCKPLLLTIIQPVRYRTRNRQTRWKLILPIHNIQPLSSSLTLIMLYLGYSHTHRILTHFQFWKTRHNQNSWTRVRKIFIKFKLIEIWIISRVRLWFK